MGPALFVFLSLLSLSFSQFNNNCGGYLSDGTTYVSFSTIEGLYTLNNIQSEYSPNNITMQVQVYYKTNYNFNLITN